MSLAPFLSRLRSRMSWEAALYLAILALAASLRLWDLGAKALHHDESLHAYYSWRLAEGMGYSHDPMMHGPFLFQGTASLFYFFGASDYTARLLQALMGTALVSLPYFLRGLMGRRGALLASLLLAVSPTMLYMSRYARHDILAATWSLALVICLWRYWESPKPRFLYLGAAILALGFATMEVTFVTGAILGFFLLLVAGRELLGRLRRRLDYSVLSPPAAFALLLGTLALPLLSALSIIPGRWLGIELSSLKDYSPYLEWKIGIALFLLFLSLGVAWRWHLRRWLLAAAIFYAIYLLLYTTFLTNPQGFATGLWGSIDYWLEQHGVSRGEQPWHYYFMLLSTYEFLPLLFAMVGTVYFTLKGDLFSRFLVYWAGASFVLFSYFGEKMPWLSVHLTLPLILLAARSLGEVLVREAKPRMGLAALLLAPVPFAVKTSATGSFDILWLGALILGLALYFGWRAGLGPAVRWLTWLLLAGLLALSLLIGLRLSFKHPDVPVEPMVYTQTSPDIPFLKEEIERLAQETGQGRDLEITVDGSDAYSWPWAWYLRDYPKTGYPCLSDEPDCSPLREPPKSAVVLLNASNENINREHLQGYAPGVTFSLRWWFPEYYRQQSLPRLLFGIWDKDKWGPWWGFFWRRELLEPIGSADAIAYFPKDFEVRSPLPSAEWR